MVLCAVVDLKIRAVPGSTERRILSQATLELVGVGADPLLGSKFPEVRVTNARGESPVLCVLDTWEEAEAEADRLLQELHDEGLSTFRERHGLSQDFVT